MPLPVLLATAFLEGLCVLLIEILGARAMAPYFGSSLGVWTSQITATLLFLALGYRTGGWLSRQARAWHLPLLFGAAGGWLWLARFGRVALMTRLAEPLGIATGSFASAVLLFGVPLLCLGAVSPVLIAAIDRGRPGAGSAAGSLFFVNTLGGLAGGWATAFLVIPYLSISTALVATGAVLVALALFWLGAGRGPQAALGGLVLGLAGGAFALFLALRPASEELRMNRVVYESESSVGTLQVVDFGFAGRRALLVDSTQQNEIDVNSGRSLVAFTDYLEAIAYHHTPHARRALVLGLGAGVVPRALSRRGLEVDAVDVDPRIEEVARRYFVLPDSVSVEIADARTVLRRGGAPYDLIVLDVFAGESMPWYLATVETFRDVAARLTPGGRLVINIATQASGDSPGLARIEAALLQVFPEARVFLGATAASDDRGLANATIVAGRDLDAAIAPPPADRVVATILEFLLPRGRPATVRAEPSTDEWSDVDYADAALRARWRELLLEMGTPTSRS